MEAKVTWKQKYAFTGSVPSGPQIPVDTTVAKGGDGTGPSPMELILIGLGGCTGMDVISILEKKQQDVTAFEVRVSGERTEDHPRVFTDIVVEYVVTGHHVAPEAVERAVELSETKYCSVSAMLKKAANITTKITIQEAE